MARTTKFPRTGSRSWPLRLAVLGAIAPHLIGYASAQEEYPEQNSPEQSSPEAVGRNLITEVTVTSRRVSESVRDVPISISAYDSKTLDVAGVKDFSGVAQFTPGVTFSPGNNLIAIRGI
ncbi:MAG TPA: hypothetical protein VFR96_09150, partial [Povalibacter sp.]|nr:hypothetical protein [Povalibacter sp.]